MVKLNIDDYSKGNPGLAGYGGLLHNDHGRWVFGFEGLLGFIDNLLLELIAICVGAKVGLGIWVQGSFLESDSFEALRLIHYSKGSHLYGTVIAEISDWLQRDWNVSISHVLREANACANYLTNTGVVRNDKLRVLQKPLVGLLPLLREDFMGTLFLRSSSFLSFLMYKKKNTILFYC